MLVLGIDPGTAITGYGLVCQTRDGLSALTYGVIRTPARQSLPTRLLHIYRSVQQLVDEHQPAVVAIEEVFFSNNARSAFAVGQARGVCLLAAAQAGRPVFECTPLEVKQAVVGYGRAAKDQVQQMVRMLLNLDEPPRPDDAADALAVAICYCHSARMTALIEENQTTG